jgi:hypothetical protein
VSRLTQTQITSYVDLAIRTFPGCTESELASHVVRYGVDKFDVYVAVTNMRNDGRIDSRNDDSVVRYYAIGAAPSCAHNRVDVAHGYVERTYRCACCGAQRKATSAVWTHWTDALVKTPAKSKRSRRSTKR